jgi:Ca2+:H+ antiporter
MVVSIRVFVYDLIELTLLQNEIRIVQASLLGSILANLLLIPGMCFLIGGLHFREQVCSPSECYFRR